MTELCVIKNIQPGRGYWRDGGNGYTDNISEAGLFTKQEANRLCGGGKNYRCGYKSDMRRPADVLVSAKEVSGEIQNKIKALQEEIAKLQEKKRLVNNE